MRLVIKNNTMNAINIHNVIGRGELLASKFTSIIINKRSLTYRIFEIWVKNCNKLSSVILLSVKIQICASIKSIKEWLAGHIANSGEHFDWAGRTGDCDLNVSRNIEVSPRSCIQTHRRRFQLLRDNGAVCPKVAIHTLPRGIVFEPFWVQMRLHEDVWLWRV